MAPGATLKCRKPRPISSCVYVVLPLIWPHMLAGMPRAMRRLERHVDQSQHGRIGGIVQIRDFFVAAVDGQGVLDQVVRADAEEIHFLDEMVDHHHGRRNFDHHADRDLAIERHAAFLEIFHHVGQNHFRLPQFLQRRDQGKHDMHVSHGAGPQDGPQLRAKQRQIPQRQADAPQTQERIALFVGHAAA